MLESKSKPLSAKQFHGSFRILIIATWILPAVVGLSFILAIGVLSFDQLLGILLTPLEPAYIIGWNGFALWYFLRYIKPVEKYISDDDPDPAVGQAALETIRGFPIRYWALFLLYLAIAPASVIWSAEYYTDYVAQPVDWFRIELIALIVSIIVGLPIFFMILDLFGRVLGNINLTRPHITIKMKVFLIGALVPLLIDTILVQYYWTRTGLFTFETFLVWLTLELLAVGASLIFVRSFSQSLLSLEGLFTGAQDRTDVYTEDLVPRSTDEIGVLTVNYRHLLDDLNVAMEVLEIRNRVLREYGNRENFGDVANAIIALSKEALRADEALLMIAEEGHQHLSCVACSNHAYDSHGHFRFDLDRSSLVSLAQQSKLIQISPDLRDDPFFSDHAAGHFHIESALACPLLVEGESIGVLIAGSAVRAQDFGPRDISLLEGIAAETALIFHGLQLSQMRDSALEEKREREERVSLLMDFTEEGIFGVDMEGCCTFINRSALRMLGYDDENELLDQSIHELIHHTRADGNRYPKEQCNVRLSTLAGESGHSTEDLHWRKDGTSFPIEYWSHPLQKNGEYIGAVVTFVDITERVAAEKELLDHRQNLELLVRERTRQLEQQATIIDQIHDSVISTDMRGIVTSWNKGAERLFGFSQNEALGRHISFVYPEEEHEFLQNSVINELVSKGEHDVEVRMRTKSGQDFHAHLSLSLQHDESGEIVGMIGYSLDITERKLAQQRLAQQKAELETANEELESFSYSVSHDLRAPLRAIDGFSLALLEDYSDIIDDTGKDYLRRVRNNTERMGLLIDDILQLSRVTRLGINRQLVDLSQLTDQIGRRLQAQYPDRRVELEIEPNLRCLGDLRLIEIMLDNLIANAWKYTSRTEQARIEFGKSGDKAGNVLYIRDNGAGFDTKYANRLFQPFQRLHRDEDFEGTGIGLAIVQRIIGRHGGEVWAEAEKDRGATFYFSLPDQTS